VVALVGSTERLTEREWAVIHTGILESARLQAPRKPLLTHGDVRPEPTGCPGPALTAWVHAGAPPPTVEDEDVDEDTLRRIVREELAKALAVDTTIKDDDGAGYITRDRALYRCYSNTAKLADDA
jgi:hypothetical protein